MRQGVVSGVRSLAIALVIGAAGFATGAAARRIAGKPPGPEHVEAPSVTSGQTSQRASERRSHPPRSGSAPVPGNDVLRRLAGIYPSSVVAGASSDQLFASVGAIRILERRAMERVLIDDPAGSLATCLGDEPLPAAVSFEIHVVVVAEGARISDARVAAGGLSPAVADCVVGLLRGLEKPATGDSYVPGDGWLSHRVSLGAPAEP